MSADVGVIDEIVQQSQTIAIVGISDREERDSNRVARYLQQAGYKVIPVNPRLTEVLGERCYPDLAAIPGPVDVVNVFRQADQTPAIARAAAQTGAKSFWLQLGVISEEAASIASDAGLQVVMDRCIKIEHQRLFG